MCFHRQKGIARAIKQTGKHLIFGIKRLQHRFTGARFAACVACCMLTFIVYAAFGFGRSGGAAVFF